MSVGIIRNLGSISKDSRKYFLFKEGDISGSGEIRTIFYPAGSQFDQYRKVGMAADSIGIWSLFWTGYSNTRAGIYPSLMIDFAPYSKLKVELTIVQNGNDGGINIAYSKTIPTFSDNSTFNSTEIPLLSIGGTGGHLVYECDISNVDGLCRYVIEGGSLFAGQKNVEFIIHNIWLEK